MPKIYTDGSAVGGRGSDLFIGWAAVYDGGVLVERNGRGTNVNAEMYAIMDVLQNLINYRMKMLHQWKNEGDLEITIVTDSKTSIQIITGYLKDPLSYDLKESKNYMAADKISNAIQWLDKNLGMSVKFQHVKGHERTLGNNFADYVAQSQSNALKEEWERSDA